MLGLILDDRHLTSANILDFIQKNQLSFDKYGNLTLSRGLPLDKLRQVIEGYRTEIQQVLDAPLASPSGDSAMKKGNVGAPVAEIAMKESKNGVSTWLVRGFTTKALVYFLVTTAIFSLLSGFIDLHDTNPKTESQGDAIGILHDRAYAGKTVTRPLTRVLLPSGLGVVAGAAGLVFATPYVAAVGALTFAVPQIVTLTRFVKQETMDTFGSLTGAMWKIPSVIGNVNWLNIFHSSVDKAIHDIITRETHSDLEYQYLNPFGAKTAEDPDGLFAQNEKIKAIIAVVKMRQLMNTCEWTNTGDGMQVVCNEKQVSKLVTSGFKRLINRHVSPHIFAAEVNKIVMDGIDAVQGHSSIYTKTWARQVEYRFLFLKRFLEQVMNDLNTNQVRIVRVGDVIKEIYVPQSWFEVSLDIEILPGRPVSRQTIGSMVPNEEQSERDRSRLGSRSSFGTNAGLLERLMY